MASRRPTTVLSSIPLIACAAALLSSALDGCSRKKPPTPAVVGSSNATVPQGPGTIASHSAAVASAKLPVVPPVAQTCQRLRSEQLQRLSAAGVSEMRSLWDDVGSCVFGERGAWALSLEQEGQGPDGRVVGCLRLSHVRVDGTVRYRSLGSTIHLARCRGHECWQTECRPEPIVGMVLSAFGVTTFDWDDDGVSDAAVTVWLELTRGRDSSRVIVVRDGEDRLELLPYTASLTIAALEDVDSDGRPDYLLPFSSGEQQDEWGLVAAERLDLVAHALPGGRVSVDDGVARGHAERQCPTTDGSGAADEVSLLCAKLRGLDLAGVAAAYRRNCEGRATLGCELDPEELWRTRTFPFLLESAPPVGN